MFIINLTPHTINIHNEDGEQVAAIPPSGSVAKIAVTREKVGERDDIPFFLTRIGQPEGLPPMREDTIYIVSGIFRSHIKRSDLYQPGELLRDGAGRPIGCIGLSQ